MMKKLIAISVCVCWLCASNLLSQSNQVYLPDTFQVLVDDFCMLEFHLNNLAEPEINESIDSLIGAFVKDLKKGPDSLMYQPKPMKIVYSRTKYKGDSPHIDRKIDFLPPEKYTEFVLTEYKSNTSSQFLNFETVILFPLEKKQVMKFYLGSIYDLNKVDSINFDSLVQQALAKIDRHKKLMDNHRFESRISFNSKDLYNPKDKAYLNKIDTSTIVKESISYQSNMEITILFKPGISLLFNTLVPSTHISINYIDKRKGIPEYSLGLNFNGLIYGNPDSKTGIEAYSFLTVEYIMYNAPNQIFNWKEFGLGCGRLISKGGDLYPANTWHEYLIFSYGRYDLLFGGILMNPKFVSFKDGWIVSEKQQAYIGVRFNI
ncbi:MAG: hypothetical protein K9H64_11220 [Bacteroidales bacterium]|nr:hypothetical protein [Bacteroidales bacterium]MCF8456521.1 hypothetical protein [Bacteroidales bacterium]